MGKRIDNIFNQEIDKELSDKEVEDLQEEVMEMLKGWAPERFAQELYGNPCLPNESRAVIQLYLAKYPKLASKVKSYRENYNV